MLFLVLAAAVAAPPVTFNRDIAPLVWRHCATCHRPGEIGPFSLLTYDEVKRHAAQIGSVTARRIMPPWKPVLGDFEGDRRLTDRDIELIRQWIADGTPEGPPSRPIGGPPVAIGPDTWRLGVPDLVVRMPEPYIVRAAGGDLFRTFVLPIPTDRARFVRAIEFRPGNARVVHHANIGIDRTRSSRELDAKDPEPGYVGGMVPDARYPEGQLLGWTPGQVPHAAPPGMSWRLEANSDLVLQLHLQPTGKPEPLQVSVAFYFTDDPPRRSPLGLRLGSETIDIPPGDARYVVRDDYVLPVDVDLLALQPHAHNLGRTMEADATLPDGTIRDLIAIDDWDFRWQDVYRYTSPIRLPMGTRIRMRYTYDNSVDNVRNPVHPPARVVWGQNTTDEMGDLWLQVVPVSPSDEATLRQDFRRKAHAEDLAAYTKLLREEPTNPLRHDAVGDLYLEVGRYDEAIAEYRASLALNDASATTHYNLGFALSVRGARADAIAQFERAIDLDPDYAQAHNNLGAILQLAGRPREAEAHYARAIALRPDSIDAHLNFAQLLSAEERAAEAAVQFRAVLDLSPDHPQALGGLAWILATAADSSLRNPDKAVAFAERASKAAPQNLSVLDALAAAYASAGRFNEAVATLDRGIKMATDARLDAAAAQLRQHRELYARGQAYRQSKLL
ncbi:MAG TPA: tetratricopeptide repeat protein [Vicinamibacterales bacterium]|nr:tetratricopeptide repeat protein [Vicinamibacterales bacterium]